MSERTYESLVSSDTPGGYCIKCSQAKIKINNVYTCPNCSTQQAAPTMVELTDKQGNVIAKVPEAEALRLEGRLDKVKKVEARLGENLRLPAAMEKEAAEIESGAKAFIGVQAQQKVRGPMITVEEIFSDLDERLFKAKFNDIAGAKKILKLRQKLALLKIELGDFLKGE